MTDSHPQVAYPDQARHATVVVEENVGIARDTYRVRFRCREIASRVVPGQFVMMRLAGTADPLLGRPLAVYAVVRDAAGGPIGLDIVYLAVGRMTRRLARQKCGDLLEIWGPLGNGFPPNEAERLIMVAGGIGQTPFLMVAQEALGLCSFGDPPRPARPARQVALCYGVRTEAHFAGVDDFRAAGVEVHLSTEDGSAGHHGLVTDLVGPLVERDLAGCRMVCCGPEPMMEKTAAIARRLNVPCLVSLETPMACGIGICFSCVARVRDAGGDWDYRRTCVEGPVFDARRIVF